MAEKTLHQPNLFSSETPQRLPSPGDPGPAENPPHLASQGSAVANRTKLSSGERWLRRLDLFLRVSVRLYLGLLLVALPWMRVWNDNHFFTLYPPLGTFAESGAVRGVVSGLGFLNLWIALSEAFHYRNWKI